MWPKNTHCVCKYIFFTCLPADGHLGWLHIFSILNCVATGLQLSLWYAVLNSFGYISRSGIVGSNGRCIFSFSEESILISIGIVLIYITTSRGFFFLCILARVYCFCVLDGSHSELSQGSFDLHYPNDKDVACFFIYLLGILLLLRKNSFAHLLIRFSGVFYP